MVLLIVVQDLIPWTPRRTRIKGLARNVRDWDRLRWEQRTEPRWDQGYDGDVRPAIRGAGQPCGPVRLGFCGLQVGVWLWIRTERVGSCGWLPNRTAQTATSLAADVHRVSFWITVSKQTAAAWAKIRDGPYCFVSLATTNPSVTAQGLGRAQQSVILNPLMRHCDGLIGTGFVLEHAEGRHRALASVNPVVGDETVTISLKERGMKLSRTRRPASRRQFQMPRTPNGRIHRHTPCSPHVDRLCFRTGLAALPTA